MSEYDEGDWESEDDFDEWWEDIWDADVEPPEFVIKDILPTGIVFMVAPPKTYKSTIEMAWTLAVAGEQCEALPAELRQVPEDGEGIVIGASAEATPGELRYMAEQGMGAKPGVHGRIRLLKDPWRFRLDDPGASQKLVAKLEKIKPKLFWLDPLVDFHSLDEVDAGEMNRLLRPLQRWAKRNRACFLVVHHTRKRSGNDSDRNLTADDARGTSALYGLADGLITLTPKGKGRVHFSVVLKRGQPFEKTVQLRVWGEGEPTVMIDGNARTVYEHLLLGPSREQQASVAEGLMLSQATVSRAISQLKSLGVIDADGIVIPGKSEAVRAATRTMQKEMTK